MKTSITVWTVSALTEQQDILKLYCHQDLAKAHAFILEKLKTHPEYIGMFITQETTAIPEYISTFGGRIYGTA